MLQRRDSDKLGEKTGPYNQCPAFLSHDSVATLHVALGEIQRQMNDQADTTKEIKAQNEKHTESLKEVKEMLGVWKDTKAVGRFFKFSAKVLLGLAGIGGAIAAIWSGGMIVLHKIWP